MRCANSCVDEVGCKDLHCPYPPQNENDTIILHLYKVRFESFLFYSILSHDLGRSSGHHK